MLSNAIHRLLLLLALLFCAAEGVAQAVAPDTIVMELAGRDEYFLDYNTTYTILSPGGWGNSPHSAISYLRLRSPHGEPIHVEGTADLVHNGLLEARMLIYSRQGQLVASYDALTHCWDGTLHGRPCPLGSYTYLLHFRSRSNPKETGVRKGTITLVQ